MPPDPPHHHERRHRPDGLPPAPVRSILAIRDDGGLALPDGAGSRSSRCWSGARATSWRELAARHGVADWTTDLDEALADDRAPRSTSTPRSPRSARRRSSRRSPPASTSTPRSRSPSVEEGRRARRRRRAPPASQRRRGRQALPAGPDEAQAAWSTAASSAGSCRCAASSATGCSRATSSPRSGPSWNYRTADGGGIVIDMFCHWNYVLENLFGRVEAVTARAVTHVPERWDEQGEHYAATADDAAYGIFELPGGVVAQINSSWCVRVYRDELVEFQVDGTHGSAVAGLRDCRVQPRGHHADAGVEPRPPDRPRTSATSGTRCPTTRSSATASGPSGSSSCATSSRAAAPLRLRCRGPRVSSPSWGCRSSAEGRRLEVP